MAYRAGRPLRQSEFESLNPAVQLRIRRTIKVAYFWGGGLILSALIFVISKPYLDKRRIERMKKPGYKPLVSLKRSLPQQSVSKREKQDDQVIKASADSN